MRALTLVADRKLELQDAPSPPAPAAGEVQIRVRAVALNHIDVWGWRGMAFARRAPGETILVHAGGSGIGTAAIKMAKAIGCTVITTVGDDGKAAKAKALGADHVINYRTDRFEHAVRKLTAKKGVDVVFEHVGAETFNGSLLTLKRGGRLVTCGSTSGPSATLNLMQLFQQQYRIIGSFGASLRNIREALDKMAAGLTPVIDTEVELADFAAGLERLASRNVFGKIVVHF